uniref:C2H2-type domain-containing protein n=1 Tax=Anopheles melas TaxID=34690 RepID=A0A182TSN8_9DIPT
MRHNIRRQVAESDPFSKLVCSKCIATVESIVEFRRSCLESFHEAERKLVPQDEPSLHKELLQVEFIKCESPGISDYDGYEQEDTFSNQSEGKPDHDGEGENSSIQASDKQCRNDDTTEQLTAATVEARNAESSENDAKDTLSTSQRSGNKSKFILKLTGIDKAEPTKTREKNKQKASSQSARPNGQIQTLRVDSSSNPNNRPKKPETVKPQIYACEVCGKTFKTKSNYTNHRKTHNWSEATAAPNSTPEQQSMSEQKRIYLCNICGHNCGSSSNLSVHLRRHNGQSVCECTKNDLKTHQKRNICGQNFDVEKLLAPRPTTICIKSPPRQSAQSSASHSTAPNAITSTYATRRDAGLNLEHEPMEDMVFPGSWANCHTTPHHFQHHERDVTDGYEDVSSYTHQSKLTA